MIEAHDIPSYIKTFFIHAMDGLGEMRVREEEWMTVTHLQLMLFIPNIFHLWVYRWNECEGGRMDEGSMKLMSSRNFIIYDADEEIVR